MGICCELEKDFRLEESNSIGDYIILLEERLDMLKKRKDSIKTYLKNEKAIDSSEIFKVGIIHFIL